MTAAALLLAACGGSDGAEGTDAGATNGSLIVDGEVDLEVLDATVTDFLALDDATQREQLSELSGQLEPDLYGLFGLEEALGGAAAVDESITEAAQWFAQLAGEITSNIASADLEPQGIRRGAAPAGGTSVAAGVFGGVVVSIVATEAMVSGTNDGSIGTKELAKGVDIKATKTDVELTSKSSFTDSKGVTTTLNTRNVVAPCPDKDGKFKASATVETSSTVNNGATGKRATFEVTVEGTVDDNAELVGYDTTYRAQYADFVDSHGGYIDITGTRSAAAGVTMTVNRSGGAVTSEIVDNAAGLGALVSMVVGHGLAEAAKKGWQSGRCVVLNPTASAGPKHLKPSASVTIGAAPRSKMDGGPVGGTVTAKLVAGSSSVSPSGTKVPADATFTYVAPNEKNKTGTVELEARSRRGIAKATMDFDTKQAGYTASGGKGVSFTGTIPDLTQPFTLAGKGTGFNVTFSFTPTSDKGGTLTYVGAGGGAGMAGSGTYTITGTEPDPLTLNYNAEGCVNVGTCQKTSNAITLTPITT